MLIVNQVTRDNAAHHPMKRLYLNMVKTFLERFKNYEITQILRGENNHTDALAEIASNMDHIPYQSILY